MASVHRGAVLHQLGRLFGLGTVAGLSEWQLLSRYLNNRDEAAFEALVARHGPMVLGVCRRLLADPNDVDDAFQATFLVLVRKANSLGECDAIGHWLYGVAYRVALRARAEAARRRCREPNVAVAPLAPETDAAQFELGSVLDEELSRLPTKYRAPLVLCYLEGLTHEEAADQLQWPLGTVKGRLVRAREVLKRRLVRRGLALSAGLSAASLTRSAVAVVPERLRSSTVAMAMKVAAEPITAGMVSASVAVLLEGVLTNMLWTKLRTATAAVLLLGCLVGSVGVVAQQTKAERPGPAPAGDAGAPKNRDQEREEGPTVPPSVPAVAPSPLREEGPTVSAVPPSVPAVYPSASTRGVKIATRPVTKPGSGQGLMHSDEDPRSQAILEKLESPISMSFANETPLEDVLKYIKSATAGPTGKGIPIYVDPVGLQEAEKTMTSPIAIDLEEVPLRTTLSLILRQLGLGYRVKEGVLIISAVSSKEDTPLDLLEEKAERGELTQDESAKLLEMLKTLNEVKKLKAEGRKLGQ